MTDSDQPNSTRPFDLQLDEWLGTHLLGAEGSGYPEDTDFERMARAVESAVLAHDAAAPLRTPSHGEGDLAGSAHSLTEAHAADGGADLDWCLAAPLPLRSGEPLNWGAELGGAQAVGTAVSNPAEQGIGTHNRPRGAEPVTSASADEPSLQELAEAMLANGREPLRKAERGHAGAEQSGVDIAGVDRISEVKPLKGARPAAKIPPPPRVAAPLNVVHLARQGATDSRGETQGLGSSEEAPAPTSLEHRANAVSVAPRARDAAVLRNEASTRKLNWLWGAMALAAAIALGVQFGKHSGNTDTESNSVAMGSAASEQLVSAQTALPQPASFAAPSGAPKGAAKAESSEAVAVADLAALPRDGEIAEPARRQARSAAADAESSAASRQGAGSRPSAAKPGQNGLEAPPSSTDSQSVGALASNGTQRTETSPAVGAESEAEPALRPAARTSGLPPEPSVGAATGAIGVVLPGARACVAGQFEPSRANVVFGSDGRVIRVEVSGPAAGTPAEACISRVLKAARVGAFSSESFSVRTTVRP